MRTHISIYTIHTAGAAQQLFLRNKEVRTCSEDRRGPDGVVLAPPGALRCVTQKGVASHSPLYTQESPAENKRARIEKGATARSSNSSSCSVSVQLREVV